MRPARYAPTSRTRSRAARAGQTPAPEQIDQTTWAVPMPIDFPNGSVRYTLTYILEDADGGLHMIDPGADSDENEDRLVAFLHSLGRGISDVRTMTATHLHADHLGVADRLRRHGVKLVMSEREADEFHLALAFPADHTVARWGVPLERRDELRNTMTTRAPGVAGGTADHLVNEGDLLPIPGRRLKVLATPGHTPGHICLIEERTKLLFTGDHLLPIVNPGIGGSVTRLGNPMKSYLASLAEVSNYDDFVACPGHGYRFVGVAHRSEEIAAHHRGRTREVADVVAADPRLSVWETARLVAWTAGWGSLSGPRLAAALAQTEMHIALVGESAKTGNRHEAAGAWEGPE